MSFSLLVLSVGYPESNASWSGSTQALVGALRARGVKVIGADVDLDRASRLVTAAASWSPDTSRWRAKFRRGPAGFLLRSLRAQVYTARHRTDALLQIGASFDGLRFSSRPGFLYCDSNTRVARRHPPFGDGGILAPSEAEAVATRELNVYRQAAGVFTMSEFLRRSFLDDFGLDAEQVMTVYAGSNLDGSAALARSARSGPPTVLFVGRQWERKGGPVLIEAMKRVHRARPEARLIVAGCRPDLGSAPNVEVVGHIDTSAPGGAEQLTALYDRADLFVMPSRYEPFGIVFVEAMLRGLPCIGSDRCAMPEIINHGETGWIVRDGDSDALAEQLIAALADRDKLAEMGRLGRTRALERFTWPKVADMIIGAIGKQL